MAVNLKTMVAGVLLSDTAGSRLYTVPANFQAVIKEIILCNTDSSARTVTIAIVPANGTGGTVLSALSAAAGGTVVFALSTVLNANDQITGSASVTNVVMCRVSGYEVGGL